MSRYRKHPLVAVFKPSHSRFALAPSTPQHTAEVWEQLKRFAPDKAAALINAAHEAALKENSDAR